MSELMLNVDDTIHAGNLRRQAVIEAAERVGALRNADTATDFYRTMRLWYGDLAPDWFDALYRRAYEQVCQSRPPTREGAYVAFVEELEYLATH